ncbi:MAG: hypothetical protein ACRD0P_29575 [Stackebrandtia sp.]
MTLLHRKRKSPVRKIRGELATGLGHFKSASGYAAEGMARSAAPRIDSALVAVGLRKRRRRRWPWVVGTVAAGTAVGVVGAMLWRRNNRSAPDMYRNDGPHADRFKFEPSPMESRVDHMAGASID